MFVFNIIETLAIYLFIVFSKTCFEPKLVEVRIGSIYNYVLKGFLFPLMAYFCVHTVSVKCTYTNI